jgi:hypothetical protein
MEIAAASFKNLLDNEQQRYIELAHHAVTSSPPPWLAVALEQAGSEHPAVQGLIRPKSIQLWKADI